MPEPDAITLSAEGAQATIALTGAEPLSWQVRGRELLWHGDPAHWERRAPILFPVVGASAGGIVKVGGQSYPMQRHGFARDSRFSVVEQGEASAKLRLTESEETWKSYPFRFVLDVTYALAPDTLAITFEVLNTDTSDMPFSLGFHPAFPWPFDGGGTEAYRVEFEAPESPEVPGVTAEGLLRPGQGRMPVEGRMLPLSHAIFPEALCILDAHSRSLAFTAPSGRAIVMATENVPHLALWTKPGAPFLSIEAWTGHADLDGFEGELFERASITRLPMGHGMSHTVTLAWREAGA